MPDSPRQILESYKQKVIDAITESLIANDRQASAKLLQSVDVKIKVFATNMEFVVMMEDYWKFVEYGVDGTKIKHGSPYSFKKGNIKADAVQMFAKRRGITQYKKPNGEVIFDAKKDLKDRKGKSIPANKKYKTLHWLIGRGIARRGYKATNFIEEAFEGGVIDNLSRDLSKALAREIVLDLKFKE